MISSPPDYDTNARMRLQALINNQWDEAKNLEFGPHARTVKFFENTYIAELEPEKKGLTVKTRIEETIYSTQDQGFARLLGWSDEKFHNENARRYLLSLRSGVKPDIRPEFLGAWEPVVNAIEKSFDGTKPQKRVEAMPRIIESISKLPAFARMHLAELLVEASESSQSDHTSSEPEAIMPPLPEIARLDPALAKGACPLADEYVTFSEKASNRAFKDFHIFAFLSLASAVIGGRAFLEIKQKRFYTNLMIIFCAATSFYAKSFTMSLVKNTLRACRLGYRLGPNRVTPQKLLSDLAGMYISDRYSESTPEDQDDYKRSIASPGQEIIIVDEIGLLLTEAFRTNSPNADFVDIMLEMYDVPEEYENRTIIRGGEPIKRPCVTWQGNCTPTNARAFAKPESPFWGTGLGARCNFVVAPPPQKGMHNHLQDEEEDDFLPIPQTVIDGLKSLHQRLGIPLCELEPRLDNKGEPTGKYNIRRDDLPENRIALSPEARRAWKRYSAALEDLSFDLPQKDFIGSYTRLPDTAMRIAVILACVNETDYINLNIWAKAQQLAEMLRGHLHELHRQITVSDESSISKLKDDIVEYLTTHPGLSVSELAQKSTKIKNNRCADARTIKSILTQLEADEIVESHQAGRTGRKKVYSLAGGNK